MLTIKTESFEDDSDFGSESEDFSLRLSSDEFDDKDDIDDAENCVYKSTDLLDYTKIKSSPKEIKNNHSNNPKLNLKAVVELPVNKTPELANKNKRREKITKRKSIHQKSIRDYFSIVNKNFISSTDSTIGNDIMVNIHDLINKLVNAQVVLKKISMPSTQIENELKNDSKKIPPISCTNESTLPSSSYSYKNEKNDKVPLSLNNDESDADAKVKNIFHQMISYEDAVKNIVPSNDNDKEINRKTSLMPFINSKNDKKITNPKCKRDSEVVLKNFFLPSTFCDKRAKVVLEKLPLTAIGDENGAKVINQSASTETDDMKITVDELPMSNNNNNEEINVEKCPLSLTYDENNAKISTDRTALITDCKNDVKILLEKLSTSMIDRHRERKIFKESDDTSRHYKRFLYKRCCWKCEKETDSFVKPKIRNKCDSCQEELLYKCSNCGKSYNNYKSLYTHAQKHILSNVKYHCIRCKLSFFRKDSIFKHYKNIHHEDKSSNANIPFYISTKISKNEKYFTCYKCDYGSRYRTELKQHIKMKHLEGMKLHKCGEMFDSNSHPSLHIARRKGPLALCCESCPFKTYSRKVMAKHCKAHLNLNRKPIGKDGREIITASCTKCQKKKKPISAEKRQSVRCHKCQSHLRFKCSRCCMEFLTIASAQKHAAKHPENAVVHECKKCGKAFLQLNHINMHHKVCTSVIVV